MARRLDYLLRLLGTAFMFTSFGLGGLFLGLVLIPVVSLLTWNRDKREKRIKWWIHKTMKLFLFGMSVFGVANLSYEGLEKVAEDKGTLLLANHPSLIDVVIIFCCYPQATCIVKKALWENPLLKYVVAGAGYIPNDKGEEILDRCREAIEKGDTLVIFPEGTRTVPGQGMKVQRGAAQIALRIGCPVRLAHIDVSPTTLTKGEKWYQIPSSRPSFRICLGERLLPGDFLQNGRPIPAAARHLTRRIKEVLDAPVS